MWCDISIYEKAAIEGRPGVLAAAHRPTETGITGSCAPVIRLRMVSQPETACLLG